MESVLIVGAGPTGLIVALGLARRGVPVHLIDKKDGPARESRAMGLHARTLEFYRQFGFGDDVVDRGVIADTIQFRAGAEDVARFSLADMGAGLSPYPFMLAFPQDEHESYLLGRLAELGVRVQWGATLEDFTDCGDSVETVIAAGESSGRFTYSYVVGCDGAHSRVRDILGIEFPGASSEQLFYVADATVGDAYSGEIYLGFRDEGLALMMPVRSTGMHRLIGLVPPQVLAKEGLGFEDLRGHIEHLLGIEVGYVNWFSTYRVHHRVAEHFGRGRIFIAGDAGHIHSPAGGQGMNTGIGDAVNLSWKLAEVAHRRADPRLLDTYEQERIPFAKSLIATTDRVFQFLVDDGTAAKTVRVHLLPRMVATMAKFAAPRRMMFKTVSQTRISYRGCGLNQGTAGVIKGGDRLPWILTPDGDNFAALQSLGWQLHIYGQADHSTIDVAGRLGVPVHQFPWSEAARGADVCRDAAYLVRPDGHVALALEPGEGGCELTDYVTRWGLQIGKPSADLER